MPSAGLFAHGSRIIGESPEQVGPVNPSATQPLGSEGHHVFGSKAGSGQPSLQSKSAYVKSLIDICILLTTRKVSQCRISPNLVLDHTVRTIQ